MRYPEPLAKLISSYMHLPGVGRKTAVRLAYFTVNMNKRDVSEFAHALIGVKTKLKACSVCGNLTESDPCPICQDPSRDRTKVLVVEHPKDVMVMEKMNDYHGLYHVLNGVLSPLEGLGPKDLNIRSLIKRLQKHQAINEVIIATNATPEGEATAMYLAKLIKPSGIKVTRLAHGLSAGSDIEYADEMTLYRAIKGRRPM